MSFLWQVTATTSIVPAVFLESRSESGQVRAGGRKEFCHFAFSDSVSMHKTASCVSQLLEEDI